MYAKLKRKSCKQCEEEKSLEFFRFRKTRGTYESYCKSCERVNNKQWMRDNKESVNDREFIRNCRKYGLTATEYERRLEKQEFVCASCLGPETSKRSGRTKRLAIDHNKRYGFVRDLLCQACNTAFGLLSEDEGKINSLLNYAKKWKLKR
jgi:Recombination endonuclease VII